MTSPAGRRSPDDSIFGFEDIEAEVSPEVLAAIDLWHANAQVEPMPDSVRERAARSVRSAMLEVAASDAHAYQSSSAEVARASQRRWTKPLVIGIIGGAAVLAAAMIASTSGSDSDRRDAFIARNPDAIVSTLRMPTEQAAHCGSVAWSPNKDEIYVFAANIPANAPEATRYTLWVDTESESLELSKFDVTNPIDQIVRLKDVPDVEGAIRFRITLDAVRPEIGPASVEIATSDAF